MRNWGSVVLMIMVVTVGMVFLVKGISGCDKNALDPETTTERASGNVIPDTVLVLAESTKVKPKEATLKNGIKAVRSIDPQIDIRNIGYSKGSYLCEYTVKNMNSITERYSVGYMIEERGNDGRYEEVKHLGDLDLGPVNPGASRNLDFTIPEFERGSGADYRVKVIVANPEKHRGEPISSATYQF